VSKSKKQSDNVDFTRFQDLTRRLVAVPKLEVDAQRETVIAAKSRVSGKSSRRRSDDGRSREQQP